MTEWLSHWWLSIWAIDATMRIWSDNLQHRRLKAGINFIGNANQTNKHYFLGGQPGQSHFPNVCFCAPCHGWEIMTSIQHMHTHGKTILCFQDDNNLFSSHRFIFFWSRLLNQCSGQWKNWTWLQCGSISIIVIVEIVGMIYIGIL